MGTASYLDGSISAFLWQRGRFTMLPTPQGMNSVAAGINKQGQIIGELFDASGNPTGVLWVDGRMIKLTAPDGAALFPAAINDRGQFIANTLDGRPFLWTRGQLTNLIADTTAVSGQVTALSGTGIATGIVTWSSGISHAVLWQAGRMIDLGLPGVSSYPQFVNDRGEVAGMVWLVETRGVPFRWQRGEVTVFPDPHADIATKVLGIDRHGRIGANLETQEGFLLFRSA